MEDFRPGMNGGRSGTNVSLEYWIIRILDTQTKKSDFHPVPASFRTMTTDVFSAVTTLSEDSSDSKLGSVALTEYRPGGRRAKRKMPEASEVALRRSPCSSPVNSTVAPGSAAPDSSRTRPVSVPKREPSASAAPAARNANNANKAMPKRSSTIRPRAGRTRSKRRRNEFSFRRKAATPAARGAPRRSGQFRDTRAAAARGRMARMTRRIGSPFRDSGEGARGGWSSTPR